MAALGLILGLLLGCALSVVSQVDVTRREASFNGTAYVQVRLAQPLGLRNGHIGLSFKSCKGGPLFRQEARPGVPGLSLEVRQEGLLLTQTSEGGTKRETILHSTRLLDNKWHTVEIVDRLGNITLSSPGLGEVQVVGEVEPADTSKPTQLTVGGKGFEGCLLEGPSIVLSGRATYEAISYGAVWGSCETDCDDCSGCGPHGTCGEDGVCICKPRFSGTHCEIDHGVPCFAHGPNLCQNGGACLDQPNGEYKCLCEPGYVGQHCELQACDHPCLNGGTCAIEQSGQHRCLCLDGFSGADCAVRVAVCTVNTCLHGGECEELPGGGFRCRCDRTGYEGNRCERNSDECLHKPCLNDGTCFDTYGGYVCQCRNGFGGPNCEQNLDECSSSPCPSGSVCNDLIGGFECVCPPGIADCATTCTSAPCQNGGTCLDSPSGFNCSCPPGFLGEMCQLPACELRPCLNGGLCKANGCQCGVRRTGIFCEEVVTCDHGLCQNGASCHDSIDGFDCTCAAGFDGPTCSHNIDDCLSSPCLNDAVCEDGAATYTCHCVPGFTGSNCEHRVDACESVPCRNGASCHTDLQGGFVCACPDGFSGERCEREIDPCESSPCLQGSSCNPTQSGGYYCECPPGLEGLQCESNIDDCQGKNCPEGQVCVDLVNDHECRCPEGFTGPNCTDDMDYCVNHRCAEGATCRDSVANYTCVCPPGYEGPLCEDNVDECRLEPNICNHGICIDNIGSYNCFCRPGFSGTHCDLDFDECLSHPCKNGASCTNMVNGYNCTCLPGFTGKDCETNINDCASSPCLNGGTCIDGINSFNCSCLEGIKGDFCEININDCEPAPCQNGGVCVDGINRYDCECAGTGYEGTHCENNIDDCLLNVCHNGATCVDQVNGFSCSCHRGYTGDQCDVDIPECDSSPCRFNGTCLELSDQSLYMDPNSPWLHLLPEHFSYETAEGFKCACPAGTMGETCEVNVNECASSPCQHGTCQDLLNAYECKCDKGFTGVHCEIDVNECEPQPCVHGTCRDLQADYLCECDTGFGGRNCSVELTGCREPVCHNNGTCHPWLFDENEHRFNCTCPKGFHGKTCSRGTTLSFAGNTSKVTVTTYREEGYDIQFRFRTTLASGQLVEGQGNPSLFFLELVSGRLNLHTSLLNRIEGVFIGSQLNDGKWKHVFLSINASHVVLSALDEQSIYPINSEYISENSTTTVFPTTKLGGSSNNPLRKANFVGSFVGCMEDVVVNGKWVLPRDSENFAADEDQGDVAQANITGVEAGCQRTEQCEPNPCHSGGTCTDLWRTFHCACQRPHLGPTCQFEMIAATFGHENASEGYVTVQASDEAKRIIRQVVSISMFVRTRKPDGVLFHLGAVDSDTVIWAQLYKGELSVHVNLNTTESYPVGGTRLDDGHRHLIEVVRNVTLVEVRINGTEYFRKTISFSSYLSAPVLFLGGKPAPEVSATEAVRAVRQASASPAPLEAAPIHPPPFKGILQDVQLSNGSATLAVQFFPLQEAQVPPPFGEVLFDAGVVMQGVVSDDACRDNPCLHEGECRVTWNDFECICPPGYKGKTCDEMEFCQLHKCPEMSTCENLDAGFECLARATFNSGPGHQPLIFEAPDRPASWWGPPEVSVDFRTASGGELVTATMGSNLLRLLVVNNGSSATIESNVSNFAWKASIGLPPGGNWTRLSVRLNSAGHPVVSVDMEEPEVAPEPVDVVAWTQLLRKGTLSVSSGYRGCLGAVRISDVLAPFFTSAEVSSSVKSRHWVASAASVQPPKGCVLCLEAECQNGGTCRDPSDAYECSCAAGFRGQRCEENIDECESHNCLNGASCQDHINSYSCQCIPGYTGIFCESDINECDSNPCLHNGTCTDELATFRCTCPEDFVGDRCESMRRVTCENRPCFNKAHCEDIPNASGDNFTCHCRDGFEGVHCKEAFCQVNECANGAFCDLETPACVCPKGYEGRFCELDIDECKPNPCMHHGRCNNMIGEFHCDCLGTGYTGQKCHEDIDECQEGPGRCGKGTCINLPGSFQCKCDNDEYCGPQCNVRNPCRPDSCQNGGTCTAVCTTNQNFTCGCQEGYHGDFCEEIIETYSEGTSGIDLALIITPLVCLLLLVAAVGLAVFVSLARKKRATRGTYSPSQQEYCNPRLELDHVLKPPPEERLI